MGKREVSKLLSRQLEREPTPLELDAVLNEMARLSEVRSIHLSADGSSNN